MADKEMEGAFQRAARSDPSDNLRRLVYADWLEEQSDQPHKERGDFTRAQLALADMPVEQKTLDNPAYLQWLQLESRALAAHGQEWLGNALTEGTPAVAYFVRGLPEVIDLSHNGTNAAGLAQRLIETGADNLFINGGETVFNLVSQAVEMAGADIHIRHLDVQRSRIASDNLGDVTSHFRDLYSLHAGANMRGISAASVISSTCRRDNPSQLEEIHVSEGTQARLAEAIRLTKMNAAPLRETLRFNGMPLGEFLERNPRLRQTGPTAVPENRAGDTPHPLRGEHGDGPSPG